MYYHNTVTDETSWTRPGSAVEHALLTSYAQDEIDAWAIEWSESGGTIPKALKKACRQLKIKKGDLEEWLELAAGARKQAESNAPVKSLRRSHTMGTTSMRAELRNTPTSMVARSAGRSFEI